VDEPGELGEVGKQPGIRREQVGVAGQCGDEHPVQREDRDPDDEQDGHDAQGESDAEPAHRVFSFSAARATNLLPAMTMSEMTTPTIPIAAAVPSCLE